MKGTTQLEVARGIAESKAQALAGEVGTLMREKDEAQQMLQRLSEYVADYSVSGSSAGAGAPGTCSAFEIANKHRFVSRLTTALEQQRSHARRIEERTAAKMQSWHRARVEVQAVERLIARREQAAVEDASRLEQRESDAAAIRTFNGGPLRDQGLG